MTTALPRTNPEDLVRDHMNIAVGVARKMHRRAPSALELDELIGLANYGLVMAADRWMSYCFEKSYSPLDVSYFIPFAKLRIEGAILDRLRQTDHATRSVRTKAKKLAAAGAGQGATEAQLVERTGLSAKEIRDTRAELERKPVGIEAAERVPVLRDVETLSGESAVLSAMAVKIEAMSPLHQTILALHYYEEMELQQIAVTLNMTESAASKVHTDAVLAVLETLKGELLSTEVGQRYSVA